MLALFARPSPAAGQDKSIFARTPLSSIVVTRNGVESSQDWHARGDRIADGKTLVGVPLTTALPAIDSGINCESCDGCQTARGAWERLIRVAGWAKSGVATRWYHNA